MFFRTTAGVLLLLVVVYGLFKAYPLLSGPEIRLDPEPAAAQDGTVTVSGRALHTETLTLDGGILLIDNKGAFSKTLTLPSGGAILSLTATDRFGRSRSIERSVYVPY